MEQPKPNQPPRPPLPPGTKSRMDNLREHYNNPQTPLGKILKQAFPMPDLEEPSAKPEQE
jgi:hypothetical protein